jgi:hypothetical protein
MATQIFPCPSSTAVKKEMIEMDTKPIK